MVFLIISFLNEGFAFDGNAYDDVHVSVSDIDSLYKTLFVPDIWKFNSGDTEAWAAKDFDDSDWEMVSTMLGLNQLPFIEWEGIGWFRLNLYVDESLVGIPFAIDVVMQSGASEIFHNGRMIYRFGEVSNDPEKEVSYQERRPKSFVFNYPGKHVLAVRYSNHQAHYFLDAGYPAGFRYVFVDLNHHVSSILNITRSATINQYLFSGILLVFTLIHFLLFLFYARHTQNLFFALFTACFGVLNYLNYQTLFLTSGFDIINVMQLRFIFIALTMIAFLRFVYALFLRKIPLQFYIFTVLFTVGGILGWFRPQLNMELPALVVLGFFGLEVMRVQILAVVRRLDSAYLFAAGLTVFLVSQTYLILFSMNMTDGISILSPDIFNVIGTTALLLTMSVSLSRNFAETNKRLELKLLEVQKLSDVTIEQERLQKEKELERRLLEADNERKTKELEEARELQLSMLPSEIPAIPDLEIAVHMKTATEVGGDYYDFAVAPDGVFTIAVGDATGHGVKAGIVVATAKSYFHSFANISDNLTLLKNMSAGIKNMNLRMIYMSLGLLKYKSGHLHYVAAGMPPMLHYIKKDHKVNLVVSKGMPLGSVVNYPYKEVILKPEKGDIIVLYSDGLTETFNTDRIMLGTDQIIQTIMDHALSGPNTIISQLITLSENWSNGGILEDDITMLIVKFK